MKKIVLGALAAGLFATAAVAHHAGERVSSGEIAVSHSYTFENAEMAHSMRVYTTIENIGAEPDKLIKASVPFADHVHFQGQVLSAEGALETRELKAITINGGQTLTLQPGAVWIELESVHETFEHGEHFDIELTFEKAGLVTVEVEVEEIEGEEHDAHDHDHEKPDA
ncbi:copper chaperone PCu(A)C [Amorphus orientalis]|uniref:Copper(I)-binding protein n=1 Tax=Amorphus orientalis TaxID=649198 RepID=A0AAE4AU85_9HYPH|nr:copper chaperone PCu(A)C [Amorphus orientalis]MDQ0315674.1 copper(I)-binding protein [Amorphus orientalis]